MAMSKNKLFVIGLVIAIGVIGNNLFFGHKFLYAGTLEATKIDLTSKLQSSISTVNVQEGARITEGQELVVLSCEDYKVNAQLANHNYNRNLRMFNKGAVSQDVMDQMTFKKQDADIHVDWCNIKSPINGTVLSRYHEPGETVSPGSKMLTLANIQDIWTYIYVPQADIAKLKVGMALKGIIPELNNREFNGTIIKINSEAEFTPKNVQTRSERTRLVFGVKISFLGENGEEVLKPGMTIELKLPG